MIGNIFVCWKWDFYKEFMSKYTTVSHMTEMLIDQCSFTSRFRIAKISTQSHQCTFYVDQVTLWWNMYISGLHGKQ